MTMNIASGRSEISVHTRRRSRLWVGAAIALVLLRLMLTADRDVVALNSPYDEYWFIHNAERLVWGGKYNLMAFAHLPIYSIWLAGLNLLGVPARLGIDLAWLISTAYAGYALVKFSGKPSAGACFWLFCAFHPVFAVLFDRALAETLLSVLVALMAGAALEIWNTHDSPHSRRGSVATWVFGVSFALAFHIRKEGVLFVMPIMFLLLCSVIRRKVWWPSMSRAALGMRLVAFPMLAVLFVGAMLIGLNYVRWGVAARYELAAPGYVRAIASLNRIDAGPGPLHVTVTTKSRQLAYEYSPTFRELQGFFEGASGRGLAAYSAQFTGQQGEIGNGWFYWALRDAGAMAGWHRDARYADQKYAAIANELETAFAKGQVKAYPSWIPSFVDPDLKKWISRVPSSTWAVLGLVLESNPDSVQPPDEDATTKQMAEFIEIAARRNPLPSVSVRGWIVLPVGSSLGIAPADGLPANWSVLAPPARPDVPGAYAFNIGLSGRGSDLSLVAKTTDGKTGAVPLSRLREGGMTQLTGELSATLGIDELAYGKGRGQLELGLSWLSGRQVSVDWVHPLGRLYGVANACLLLALLCVAASWGVTRRVHPVVFMVCGLTAITILARAALVGILDASSWNAIQARYMMPLVPAFAFAIILGLASLRERR